MQSKKILYITTQILGEERYFTWASYPSIWYSRIQKNILKMLGAQEGIEIYVRFYPNDLWLNPQIEWVKKNYPQIKVLEVGLPAVLEKEDFDLVITEACATTLLEVLCTKSKILAFIPKDFIKLHKDAKILLKRRIQLVETCEKYYTSLEDMLLPENLNKPLSIINDDFLFAYGINSPQDDPLMLTKKAIESIIQFKENK